MCESAGWEFVSRTRGSGVVGIIAQTTTGRVVLVEQYRQPVHARVVELPAGLVGDDEEESVSEAARRELREETGFTAPLESFKRCLAGPSSAGLTDELVELVFVTGVQRTERGGGVGEEDITVFEVPLEELGTWLARREARGALVDFKVRLAGLMLGAPLDPQGGGP